ncbi:MAG: ELM1/GtrOC1 family putative glycosyltransferase, partial [Thiobacillus sp.]|nr:ELM1/GtrOC1 family putative glycosyltransferase [Thiobacillus sp.]
MPALNVWVISDGKPGHVNQSLGLAEALARATPARIHHLTALPVWRAWLILLFKISPDQTLPAPDLIIGAGHATHLTLLVARRARGGRAVVLMKPSLPRRWFDLCILPQHDGVAADAHTLVTEGALNRICPSS